MTKLTAKYLARLDRQWALEWFRAMAVCQQAPKRQSSDNSRASCESFLRSASGTHPPTVRG